MSDAALRRALDRRGKLLADGSTTAVRWVNARADTMPDVTVDLFGRVAVLSLYRSFSDHEERALADAVLRTGPIDAVYLKRRPREARVAATVAKADLAPEAPIAGVRADQIIVLENGLSFIIRPGQGLSVGLYLDMRDTRQWLRERVSGASVLNTFAYTCAFGVYAHAGAAQRVVNLDLSRRVLEWGEENLTQNGESPDRKDHLAGDTFEWLKRFGKKEATFDVVVLDPPSFSSGRAGRFSAQKDYPKLVAAAAPIVTRGGLLVACTNLEELPGHRFEAMIDRGVQQAGRRGKLVERLGPSPIDFPATPEEPAALKVRVYELR